MFGESSRSIGLRSHSAALFPSPHFCSQSTKPSKAVTLPLIKKCGTRCAQHGTVTRMEEMHEKEFQQKQLAREWAGLSYLLCHFSWVLANSQRKKKMFHKGKMNLQKYACARGPLRISRAVLEEWTKIKSEPQGNF